MNLAFETKKKTVIYKLRFNNQNKEGFYPDI